MKLSVIVVSQNACALLKQALNSVINATKGTEYELLIVDNASTDKTLEILAAEYPEAQVIANDTDLGIAKASNQALRMATGEYILMVNADTISGKDSIEKMTAFMDEHYDAAGVGVRMLSPQGRFLPESVHGLTKTWAAFFKLIGFAKYLSKTRLYNRNRKDWVEEFRIAEVDILNGAFMMLRRSALLEIGLFDERFTKYGYDIDLTYRMRLAGFKNYYYPKTYIINFENNRWTKLSWGHVKNFYGAMFNFAVKYLLKVPEIKVAPVPQLFPSAYEVK
jgi:GT2 family glycosyltransferase